MFQTMFNRGSLPGLEAVAHFTSLRHKAISNNIANVDTPGYKAVDAPEAMFQKLLERAYEDQQNSRTGVFEMESRREIRATPSGLEILFQPSSDAGILRHDENNVDLDIEMGKMVKNAGVYNMVISLMGQQFSMMREAISERVA